MQRPSSKGPKDAAAPEVGLCNPQSVVLLMVMPFINVTAVTYVYTALPLHWIDSSWELWELSLLLTLCYSPRLVMSVLVAKVRKTPSWPRSWANFSRL